MGIFLLTFPTGQQEFWPFHWKKSVIVLNCMPLPWWVPDLPSTYFYFRYLSTLANILKNILLPIIQKSLNAYCSSETTMILFQGKRGNGRGRVGSQVFSNMALLVHTTSCFSNKANLSPVLYIHSKISTNTSVTMLVNG